MEAARLSPFFKLEFVVTFEIIYMIIMMQSMSRVVNAPRTRI